ncbi:MAG: sporulation transcriptional regulator SpoIIID [Oscillospiraceae bacterium]|jgi:putative DeoR family transcriptional regulator (stage III sporulation protein D)|nr:sporulation transcriptional regulator SpoIIID [Oscillospiraceae bacterium]
MKDYIEARVLQIAAHIIQTGATVRQAAKVFRVSKSTVHKDMDERLPELDADLAAHARQVLARNKAERHLRGGEATCRKYRQSRAADA